MADLANEGRGGAVGGQPAARERAAGGPGATGPRAEHPGVRGACLLRESGPVGPSAVPHCVPSGRAHRPGPSLPVAPALPPSGQTALETAGAAALRPFRLAGQAGGRRGRERGLNASASDVNGSPGLVAGPARHAPSPPPRSRGPRLSPFPCLAAEPAHPPVCGLLILRGPAPRRGWRTSCLFSRPPPIQPPSSRQFPRILPGDPRVAPRLRSFRSSRRV